MKTLIYADHAATTSLSPAAMAAMEPWLRELYGNPSAPYNLARQSRKALAQAREMIAAAIGASPEEIYFTSGGTEADNWALVGSFFRRVSGKSRLITSCIEHHAVLRTCEFLNRLGCEIVYLPVDGKGIISVDELSASINDGTMLVSVMTANNEIGTIEPIRKLADIAHSHGALFHTDAVQAVGHIPLNVKEMNIDLLSASAHKFNGPKGVGFLFIRNGVEVEPLLHGGGQESRRRAGTENVPGIIGMSAALKEHIDHMELETRHLVSLRDTFLNSLRDTGLDYLVNGAEYRIPGSVSISFRHADGEMLLHRLDLKGTTVATGSACNSKETVLSHVIQSIGIPNEYAHGTIRISLGMENTEEQMRTISQQIAAILQETT